MTDREKLIEILDNAGIGYGFSDCKLVSDSGAVFHFKFNGALDYISVEKAGYGYY